LYSVKIKMPLSHSLNGTHNDESMLNNSLKPIE